MSMSVLMYNIVIYIDWLYRYWRQEFLWAIAKNRWNSMQENRITCLFAQSDDYQRRHQTECRPKAQRWPLIGHGLRCQCLTSVADIGGEARDSDETEICSSVTTSDKTYDLTFKCHLNDNCFGFTSVWLSVERIDRRLRSQQRFHSMHRQLIHTFNTNIN